MINFPGGGGVGAAGHCDAPPREYHRPPGRLFTVLLLAQAMVVLVVPTHLCPQPPLTAPPTDHLDHLPRHLTFSPPREDVTPRKVVKAPCPAEVVR